MDNKKTISQNEGESYKIKLSLKRQRALELLKLKQKNVEINTTLKKEFGTGLSARDLKTLRSTIIIIPKKNLIVITAFRECFDYLAEMNANNQLDTKGKELVDKYVALNFNLYRWILINNTPKSIRMSDSWLRALEGLQDMADNY
jgi:ribosomal protein L28